MSLAALAAAGGFGIASGLLNQHNSKEMASINQKYYKENQEQAYQNQRKLIRDASALEKSGMIAAGFSPTAMAGATPATPSVPSVPMPSNSHGSFDLAGAAQLANVESASNLNNAAAEKAKAEAESTNIQNTRAKRADRDYEEAVKKQLEDSIKIYDSLGLDSSDLRREYDSLLENGANLGTYEANLKAIETSVGSAVAFTRKLETLLEQSKNAQMLLNRSFEDYGKIPRLERELLEKQIALKMAERYYMTTSGDMNVENIKKVAIEKSKLNEEITLMKKQGKLTDAQANQVRNSDVATLVDDGEIMKAITAEGVTATHAFSKGLGQGAGAVAALRFGGTALSKSAKTATPISSTLERQIKGIEGYFSNNPKMLEMFHNLQKRLGSENAVKSMLKIMSKR